jgi:hypothetical protein
MIVAFLALAAGPFSAIPQGLPPHPPTHGGDDYSRPSNAAITLSYEAKAKALRDEMHALQAADGGELTAQHRAELRSKAVALLSAYRDEIRLNDPMSVNADGTLVR